MRVFWFSSLLMLVFAGSLYAQGSKLTATSVNEFRSHKFGTPPSPKMTVVPDSERDGLDLLFTRDNGVKVYKLPNEHLKIGTVDLKSIHYHFFENQLFKVVIDLPFETYIPRDFCNSSRVAALAFEEKYNKRFEYPRNQNKLGETVGYINFSNFEIMYICSTDYMSDNPDRAIRFIIRNTKLSSLADAAGIKNYKRQSGVNDL